MTWTFPESDHDGYRELIAKWTRISYGPLSIKKISLREKYEKTVDCKIETGEPL